MSKAYLVLDKGPVFEGKWLGGKPSAGEVVFNTSHSGYEEIATDPSYFNQIMIMTAPQQGNYGSSSEEWESEKIHLKGFVALELQKSVRDSAWMDRLVENEVPVVEGLNTRELVLHLRSEGTVWGALVPASSEALAREQAARLVLQAQQVDLDWPHLVSCDRAYEIEGSNAAGPRVAVLDFGSKKNILRELEARTSRLKVFPSRTSAKEILSWSPDGIMLTNGPGDPEKVEVAVETIQGLVGQLPIFGICMGHQLLARALGARTRPLKFGHRGSNHPIKDSLLGQVYVTSQNHGYVVEPEGLPDGLEITHTNLNDGTLAGFVWKEKSLLGVQFHPESHPGPHESVGLFDYFMEMMN